MQDCIGHVLHRISDKRMLCLHTQELSSFVSLRTITNAMRLCALPYAHLSGCCCCLPPDAGATASMYLASAGYQVDVVERRGHPGEVEVDKRRTFLIGLGEAGGQVTNNDLTM